MSQEEVLVERKHKDRFFQVSEHSPFPVELRKSFTGLSYYSYNKQFSFELEIKLFEKQETIEMKTSDDKLRLYIRTDYVEFNFNGTLHHLTLFKASENDFSYFVPFRDETSGKETYGSGRYIEPRVLKSGKVLVDFNTAYNPYCAYNCKYSCPIPPIENHLKLKIEAGEKVPKD